MACEASGLPWHIVGIPSEDWIRIEPTGFVAPLVGRGWSHGVLDCYSLVRDWFLKPPRRPPPRPAIPKLHDHDIDMHLMGVSAACLGKAAKFDLKGTLEAQVGASFSSWLSDRRAAFALKMATRDWIAAQCEECLAGFPHAEAGKTRDQVRAYATCETRSCRLCCP